MSIILDQAHYEEVIARGLLKASRRVWIASANLKDVHLRNNERPSLLLAHFSKMAEKGIEIRILHGGEPSRLFKRSFDRFPNLVAGGIEMQMCVRIHCKLIIVDGAWAYLGSANLTGAGLGAKSTKNRNFEAGCLTRQKDEVEQLVEYFDNLWIGTACQSCGRRKICPDPIV